MDEALDKEQIAKSFLRGQETYDSNATVQKKVSQKIIELLDAHSNIQYGRVLEIGCCTGTLTRDILEKYTINKFFLNDLVPEFFKAVCSQLPEDKVNVLHSYFGDIEQLDLPGQLDLVISSSTFQWLNDLETLFQRVAESLNRNGYLVFSLFGPGTLHEFKELTGVGLKYTALGRIIEMLEKNFFVDYADTRTDVLYFDTPREVLRHLQATGVGGVGKKRWSRSRLKTFESDYIRQFGTDKGVPVSFFSSFVVASKK